MEKDTGHINNVSPFLEFIFLRTIMYMPKTIRLLMTYAARAMLSTFGSPKGILFDTCASPRMIIKLVLHHAFGQPFSSLSACPGCCLRKVEAYIKGVSEDDILTTIDCWYRGDRSGGSCGFERVSCQRRGAINRETEILLC